MDLVLAIAEDQVPGTREPDPCMQIFLDAGMGSILAFFEIPNSPSMGRDPNSPGRVPHIAFEVEDMPALIAARERIEAHGPVRISHQHDGPSLVV